MNYEQSFKRWENAMGLYEGLLKDIASLKTSDDGVSCGMDDFLAENNTMKVASLGDLDGFFRLSSDTLVHKAKKDLWKISEDESGNVVILRMFDPQNNEPLKV